MFCEPPKNEHIAELWKLHVYQNFMIFKM